jgi:EmrB/QacA subfamily drug resistance transporter
MVTDDGLSYKTCTFGGREMVQARWAALMVLCAGSLMIVVDQTIVSVALPAIKADLGFSEPGLAWVVNGYVAPFGGLLLLAGRLGDMLGRRRMFVAGMVVFTVASLLCGLATSAELLIGARFVQGVGGAMCSAVTLGMIISLFPAPLERGRAIGVFSFAQAAGGSIGALLGGVLTQVVSWEWIFLINIPLGLVTVAFALRLLAKDNGQPGGSDVLGGALVTGGLILAIYTIVNGFSSIVAGVSSVVLLVAFAVREATAPNPLLPLRMFRSRTVSGANVTLLVLIAGMFGFLFFSAQYLQISLGYTPLATGLGMLPVAVSIGAVSLGLSATLTTRFGAQRVLLGGLVLITAGLALLGRVPAGGSFVVDVLPAMLLIGVGFGAAMPALMGLGMSAATTTDAGVTSGMFSTSQQIGGALGLSAIAALAAGRTDHLRTTGATEVEALTSGFRVAFFVSAGFALAALIAAALIFRKPAPVEQREPVA